MKKEGEASLLRPDNDSYKRHRQVRMDEWPVTAAAQQIKQFGQSRRFRVIDETCGSARRAAAHRTIDHVFRKVSWRTQRAEWLNQYMNAFGPQLISFSEMMRDWLPST